jgi:hypothetical protein
VRTGYSADSDGDGLNDGAEVYTYSSHPNVPDTDGDGLSDGDEVNSHGTDPVDPDTDNDGLNDGYEVNTSLTNPLNPDTDGDLLNDGDEVNVWSTDPLADDSDSDGISDGFEVLISTDPAVPDSDGDGIPDGEEALIYLTDPGATDTDGDGMDDDWEILYISCVDPLASDAAADPDGDGADNQAEFLASTDPCLIVDTDGDGMPDGWEDSYACVDSAVGDSLGDPDGDGRTSLQEWNDRTDPCVSDLLAAPLRMVNYQGRLTDPVGTAVSDTVDMTFLLFDGETGGTALWSESHLVAVDTGIYSVLLGGNTAIPLSALLSPDLYLEVSVDSETLIPRQKVTATLFSLNSDRLEGRRLETGARTLNVAPAASQKTVHVSFGRPFSAPPRVTVTGLDNQIGGLDFVLTRIYNVTSEGFDVQWKSMTGGAASGSAEFGYYAFGE